MKTTVRSLLALLTLCFSAASAFAASADLVVARLRPRPATVAPGMIVGVDFILRNAGPDDAKNVVVTFDFPAGMKIVTIFGDRSTCDFSRVPLRCTAGDMAANELTPRAFDLELATESAQDVTIIATVSSDTPDPNPANNSITQAYEVIDAVDTAMRSEPSLARVNPGESVTIQTTAVNELPTSPADIHVHYEASNALIESIDAPGGWTCSIRGSSAECVAPSLDAACRCSRNINVVLRTSADRSGGTATLKSWFTTSLPELNPGDFHSAQSTVQVYSWISVTNTLDSGPGSLRDAIERTNHGCQAACKIVFEIAEPLPAEGWFTITSTAPLPAAIAPRLFIDGTTQKALTGDSNPAGPEIALDGRLSASDFGIDMRSPCEGIVEGLAIGRFRGHAIRLAASGPCMGGSSIDARRIAHNFLGTDPTGTVAWPNLRGILADGILRITDNLISGNARSGIWIDGGLPGIYDNRIGTAADGRSPLPNGASGIYLLKVGAAEVLRNTIAFNPEMGVAIAREAQQVDVRQNSMHDNGGLGIDIGLDGANPPGDDHGPGQSNAPSLLSAAYDPTTDTTTVTGTLVTGPFGPYFNSVEVDLYANGTANAQGEQWIGSRSPAKTNGETWTVSLKGDYRGQWINATSTRVYWYAAKPPVIRATAKSPTDDSIAGGQTATSEFSNAVRAQ